MTANIRIIALGLATALAGGALAGCSSSAPNANETATQPAADQTLNANANTPANQFTNTNAANVENQQAVKESEVRQKDSSYREGYREGTKDRSEHTASTAAVDNGRRQTYYDYNHQPQNRSFWQKHRDKTTVAAGAGGGALLGALIGGGKGAGIGAIAGSAGSALYTYKLRKKNNNNDNQ